MWVRKLGGIRRAQDFGMKPALLFQQGNVMNIDLSQTDNKSSVFAWWSNNYYIHLIIKAMSTMVSM
jgi:hypothetical protein